MRKVLAAFAVLFIGGCASVQRQQAIEEPTYTISFEHVECERAEETCLTDFRVSGSGVRIRTGVDRWELDAIARSLVSDAARARDLEGVPVVVPDLDPNLALNLLAVRELHRKQGYVYRPPSSDMVLDRVAYAFARMEKPDLHDIAKTDQFSAAALWFLAKPFSRSPLTSATYDFLVRNVREYSGGAVTLERADPKAFALTTRCACGVEYLALWNGKRRQFVVISTLLPIVWFVHAAK